MHYSDAPIAPSHGVDNFAQRSVRSITFKGEAHMNKSISLIVDGKPAQIEADPAMPLLYALRSELGLNNPKFGCGKAQCGACTVHLDGAPVRSCVTPVEAASGRTITTLAGLGTPEKPHPLQKAY